MFEYERLKQNYLFPTIKGNNISNNTITIFVHNARSLSKHMDDIVSDDRIINNDITGFTETQINPWDSTWKIIETLNFFIIYFNNNENNFLNLANRCKNNAAILIMLFLINLILMEYLSLASRNTLLLPTEY